MEAMKALTIAIILVLLVYISPVGAQIFLDEPIARLGKGRMYDVTYSPDGKMLAMAGGLGIWLCDANNLEGASLLQENAGPVYSVAFHPDGRILAYGDVDGAIRLWDLEEAMEIVVSERHSDIVDSITFSPDGKTLASISRDGDIRLWDVVNGKGIAAIEGWGDFGAVSLVVFSPDSRILASIDKDGGGHLWDLVDKREIAVIELQEHSGPVSSVAFSPDGRTLACAVGSVRVGSIHLWDLVEGKEIAVFGHPIASDHGCSEGWVVQVAFSPDGKILASGGGEYGCHGRGTYGTICLRDMEKNEEMAILLGHAESVYSLAFSPDGRTLASAGENVRLWNIESGEQIAVSEGHTYGISSVVFSPDGGIIASGSFDETIRLWDVEKRSEIFILDHPLLKGYGPGPEISIAFSPDGKLLASGGSWGVMSILRLWDVAGGKEITPGPSGPFHHVSSVAFSPDGKILASGGSQEMEIYLWDVEEKEEIGILEGHSIVWSIDFSPDGKLLASGGVYGISLWDVESRTLIALLDMPEQPDTYSVAFNPDGKLLASGGRDGVHVWDVKERKEIAVLEGHAGSQNSVAFSPDGRIIASAGRVEFSALFDYVGDVTVRLWDVYGKEEMAVLEGHNAPVTSIAFSPDGQMLASGSWDCTICLWGDIPTSVEPKSKYTLAWGKLKDDHSQRANGHTRLFQNYPNPFNPETWIPFGLAQESDVVLRIYDAKGSLVREISLGKKPAGSYIQRSKAIHWDGRNDSGERVASGVYFYTLQAGDYTETQKMILAE